MPLEVTFAEKVLYDAGQLKDQLDDLEPIVDIDELDDSNSYTMRTGRDSGFGAILLRQKDYANIANPRHFIHDLEFTYDYQKEAADPNDPPETVTNTFKIEKLAITRARGVFADVPDIAQTPDDQATGENTLILCELGDPRIYADQSYFLGDINEISQKTSSQLLQDIWAGDLTSLFGSLTIPSAAELGETTIVPDGWYFPEMSAWAAFWTILDGEGWDFVVGKDGGARVITGEADTFTEDPDNAGTQMFDRARDEGLLIDFGAEQLQPSLPETITVFAHKRDFPAEVEQAMMATPDHSRLPVHKTDITISDARVQPGTRKILWGPYSARYDADCNLLNAGELAAAAQEVADRFVNKILLKERSSWEFSGMWAFEPGYKWGEVEISDTDDGWTTRVDGYRREKRPEVRWGSLSGKDKIHWHVELKEDALAAADEHCIEGPFEAYLLGYVDDGQGNLCLEKCSGDPVIDVWNPYTCKFDMGTKMGLVPYNECEGGACTKIRWHLEDLRPQKIIGYVRAGGVPAKDQSGCWGEGQIDVYSLDENNCEVDMVKTEFVYNGCEQSIDAGAFIHAALIDCKYRIDVECCPPGT